MKELLEQMKDITIVEPIIHIKTTMSKENEEECKKYNVDFFDTSGNREEKTE